MDGIHDVGGMQGFGAVTKQGRTHPFVEPWEITVSGFMSKLVAAGVFNMDEYRHAIERLSPLTYLQTTYFERSFTAILMLCAEKGVIDEAELQEITAWTKRPGAALQPGRIGSEALPDLKVGDRVRVRDDFFAGHIRMPAYVRGRVGLIVSISPAYAYPDAHAHGLGSGKQLTFDVRFHSRDLWGDGCDDAFVNVGLFHSYLEKLSCD